MYVTYEEYGELGGALDEKDFATAEPRAEMLLDGWTLNRLKSERVVADLEQMGEYQKVKVAMAGSLTRCRASRRRARRSPRAPR